MGIQEKDSLVYKRANTTLEGTAIGPTGNSVTFTNKPKHASSQSFKDSASKLVAFEISSNDLTAIDIKSNRIKYQVETHNNNANNIQEGKDPSIIQSVDDADANPQHST